MKILVWHVHGGWMDGFLRGNHEYLVPFGSLSSAPKLPPRARAVSKRDLLDESIDIVVLQRIEEIEWVTQLLGRTPGKDIPAVFVEHNTPKQRPIDERHPLADQEHIPVIHVTHFNRLVWDCGRTPVRVIEHGVPDPGYLYTGELPSLGVVINEPVRRNRVTGTDLLPAFANAGRLDVFGIDTGYLPDALGLSATQLSVVGDLETDRLHSELARRRAYLHTCRWTSLGLSLLEAMTIGMPVLALAATEAPRAVPPEAGAISTDLDELRATAVRLLADPEEARSRGTAAREFALEHYGLDRFLADWDEVLEEFATKLGVSGRPAGLLRNLAATTYKSARV